MFELSGNRKLEIAGVEMNRRADVLIMFCLGVCVFVLAFGFQGTRGIWGPDEGFYVGTAVTMLGKGDIIVPHLGEAIFLEKPPMTYWGIIAGLKLFGHTEFGCRAFNGLCYIITAVAVSALGYYLFASVRKGLIAGFMYATMVVPFIAANFVTPDTPLALWTTVTGLLLWRSAEVKGRGVNLWKMLMYASAGVGFLCKGPAVMIPCGGMFVFLLVRRKLKEYFLTWWTLLGIAIFCVVGLGWYVYTAVKVPGAGWYFWDNEVWGRLVSGKYKRNPGLAGAMIYVPVLVLGSLPWSGILWGKMDRFRRAVFNKSWWAQLRNRPAALFLLTWFCVPLLILCLASSKLGFYVLPLFGVLSLVIAWFWTEKAGGCFSFLGRGVWPPVKLGVIATGCWILLLPGVKFALAHYPIANDSRPLWGQIKLYLPGNQDYEIVTIDERADGLLFYGAKEVEHVTTGKKPYPTFDMPEELKRELKDIAIDKHWFVFVVRNASKVEKMRVILKDMGIDFEEVALPYERQLLICRP